jgi:hypothetical protein
MTPEEELALIERDIQDAEEWMRVELIRADRERVSWTPAEQADFDAARKADAERLLDLVTIRDEMKRMFLSSQRDS